MQNKSCIVLKLNVGLIVNARKGHLEIIDDNFSFLELFSKQSKHLEIWKSITYYLLYIEPIYQDKASIGNLGTLIFVHVFQRVTLL